MVAFLSAHFRTIALALASCLLSADAFAEAEKFRDWSVTCTAAGCSAETEDRNGRAGALTIERAATPTAIWEIHVETTAEKPSRVGPTGVRIAGQRPIQFAPNRDFATFGVENRFYLINSAYLQLLFRRMIESRRVFFTFDGLDGREMRASYSLNGLAAALQRIDEKQNRLGSRREAGPPLPRATAVPVEKDNGAKTEADLIALAREHQTLLTSGDTCPAIDDEANREVLKPSVHALDDQQTLILLPCFVAAYNTGMQAFIYVAEAERPSLVYVPTFEKAEGWYATNIIFGAAFDEENKTLSSFYKGRGLGDCGFDATYAWSVMRFNLKTFAGKDVCDGKGDDWPIIFPAQPAKP